MEPKPHSASLGQDITNSAQKLTNGAQKLTNIAEAPDSEREAPAASTSPRAAKDPQKLPLDPWRLKGPASLLGSRRPRVKAPGGRRRVASLGTAARDYEVQAWPGTLPPEAWSRCCISLK